jgi:hypothetical protein
VGQPDLIVNGGLWFDSGDNVLQAHGGSIIKVGNAYYWFGEAKAHPMPSQGPAAACRGPGCR